MHLGAPAGRLAAPAGPATRLTTGLPAGLATAGAAGAAVPGRLAARCGAAGPDQRDLAVHLGDVQLQRVEGDLQLQRGGRGAPGRDALLRQVEPHLAHARHLDVRRPARGERDLLAEDADGSQHVRLGAGPLPRLAHRLGGDLLRLDQGPQRRQAGHPHLGPHEVGVALGTVAVGGAPGGGGIGAQQAERLAVVEAVEVDGERGLGGGGRGVHLVQHRVQRHIDRLVQQPDVQAGAQHDRVGGTAGRAVASGGMGGHGAEQEGGAGRERGGNEGRGEASGHAEGTGGTGGHVCGTLTGEMEPPAAPMGDIARAGDLDPHIVSAPAVNREPRAVSSPY